MVAHDGMAERSLGVLVEQLWLLRREVAHHFRHWSGVLLAVLLEPVEHRADGLARRHAGVVHARAVEEDCLGASRQFGQIRELPTEGARGTFDFRVERRGGKHGKQRKHAREVNRKA
jgi:hypothetical protein